MRPDGREHGLLHGTNITLSIGAFFFLLSSVSEHFELLSFSMSQNKPPQFSEPRQCGHCGSYATMKVVAEFKNLSDGSEDYPFREGQCYRLLQCAAQGCKKVELETYDYSDAVDYGERPDFNCKTLYP